MLERLGRLTGSIRGFGCLAVIVIAVVLIIASVVMYFVDRPAEYPETAYMVETVTRVLFAEEAVENEDKSVTLTNWYESYKGRWVKHKDSITIPLEMQPQVKTNKGMK